jgi:hypothetical protein
LGLWFCYHPYLLSPRPALKDLPCYSLEPEPGFHWHQWNTSLPNSSTLQWLSQEVSKGFRHLELSQVTVLQ